jgi:hypothetical protein
MQSESLGLRSLSVVRNSNEVENATEYVSPFHNLKAETDPDSETLFPFSLNLHTIDKVLKPGDSECYTPVSELFRFDLLCRLKHLKELDADLPELLVDVFHSFSLNTESDSLIRVFYIRLIFLVTVKMWPFVTGPSGSLPSHYVTSASLILLITS